MTDSTQISLSFLRLRWNKHTELCPSWKVLLRYRFAQSHVLQSCGSKACAARYHIKEWEGRDERLPVTCVFRIHRLPTTESLFGCDLAEFNQRADEWECGPVPCTRTLNTQKEEICSLSRGGQVAVSFTATARRDVTEYLENTAEAVESK